MKKSLLVFFIFLSGCAPLTSLLPTLGGGSSTKGHGNDNTLQVSDSIKSNTFSRSKDFHAKSIEGSVYQHETNHGFSLFDMVILGLLMSIIPSWIPYKKIGVKVWKKISMKG